MEQGNCFAQNPDCADRNCATRGFWMDKPAFEGYVQYCLEESEGVNTDGFPGEVCGYAAKTAISVQAGRKGEAEPAEVR